MDVATGIRRLGRGVVRAAAMATADLRPEPDLIVVGVKRGGTTSLFRDLERHPAMCPLVPSARRLPMMRENMKGVHYFDSDMRRSLRWYRSHFPTSVSRAWRARTAGASFAAEASPYYFFHPLAARRACDVLTDTVFVVMLRDPVERTISHWAEQTRNGVETLTLADAVAAEADRVGDDGDHLDVLGNSHAHEQQTYVSQSCYADSHARWAEAAGDDRLITVFSEDYYRDAAGVIGIITDALGLPPIGAATTVHRNAAPRPASIDPALEAKLIEHFRPDVERLADRLGRRPPWPRFAR